MRPRFKRTLNNTIWHYMAKLMTQEVWRLSCHEKGVQMSILCRITLYFLLGHQTWHGPTFGNIAHKQIFPKRFFCHKQVFFKIE
jgi:hypothetical protein